ncbi:MAG TPA: ribokinase [Acetobacteraceae bacterium]
MDRFDTPVLLSVGSINADFQFRVPRPLQAGETLLGSDFVRLGGGKAANRAFLAHRLGHPVRLLGRVGDDELRSQALAPLSRAGLALDHVTTARETPTAVSMIAVPPDGKKSILLAANANDAWDEAAVADALAVIEGAAPGSILTADCEIMPGVTARLVAAGRARGLRVVLDPAPPDRADRALLAGVDALSPDAREAAALTGIATDTVDGAAAAAVALAGEGVSLVCVKLGDGGCVGAFAGCVVHVPPTPVNVVDSTGAGDAFTGALGVALLERQSPDQALLFATAASHCAVTAYGSQEAYPTRPAIEALIPRLAAAFRIL